MTPRELCIHSASRPGHEPASKAFMRRVIEIVDRTADQSRDWVMPGQYTQGEAMRKLRALIDAEIEDEG